MSVNVELNLRFQVIKSRFKKLLMDIYKDISFGAEVLKDLYASELFDSNIYPEIDFQEFDEDTLFDIINGNTIIKKATYEINDYAERGVNINLVNFFT
jgi:hypothetical protein